MTITAAYGTLSASEHSAQLRKAVIASTIGTSIEWYDFFLYGTAAGLIFGKLFFPNSDPLTATFATEKERVSNGRQSGLHGARDFAAHVPAPSGRYLSLLFSD